MPDATIAITANCHVYDTYGMPEIVPAASECGAANLHLWPEAGIVEVFDDQEDRVVPFGTAGRLVCTA